jgi:hypothetical protein
MTPGRTTSRRGTATLGLTRATQPLLPVKSVLKQPKDLTRGTSTRQAMSTTLQATLGKRDQATLAPGEEAVVQISGGGKSLPLERARLKKALDHMHSVAVSHQDLPALAKRTADRLRLERMAKDQRAIRCTPPSPPPPRTALVLST